MATTEAPPVNGGPADPDSASGIQGADEAVSPRHVSLREAVAGVDEAAVDSTTTAVAMDSFPSIKSSLGSFSLRPDPDAQATVTDFLDFTEYLPSDMVRSLTLIGKLDQTYIDASTKVHDLTGRWSNLSDTTPDTRPSPVALRADISANLAHGLNSRVYAHAEAIRMADNVNRHYWRAKTILAKLQTMLENYPEAEQQQQEQQQQQQRQKQQREQEQLQQQQQKAGAQGRGQKNGGAGGGQPKIRRQRVPRITVPGEVLAPYDLDYETYSDDSDVSSVTSDAESIPAMRRTMTPAAQPRIRVIKAAGPGGSGASSVGGASKPPKVRIPRAPRLPGQPYISTSFALAQLKPPPENAVIGSADAPWLQLTPYELAKLRKRMKKNAQWTPSETMIARELKSLGRHLEAYNEAKRKAEDEGRTFDGVLPETVVESDGIARTVLGALTVDAAMAAEDKQLTNRGVKLNEAKKLKNSLAQLAAQEAEESTRRMVEATRVLLSPYVTPSAADQASNRSGSKSARATTPATAKPLPHQQQQQPTSQPSQQSSQSIQPLPSQSSLTPQQQQALSKKRKRDGSEVPERVEGSAEAAALGGGKPLLAKRVKTETPVPIPQPTASAAGPMPAHETPVHPPPVRHSATPVPAPVRGPTAGHDQAGGAGRVTSTSPRSLSNLAAGTITTSVPLKPPGETPIPPPQHSPRKSTTPIHPPVRELRVRDALRREAQPLAVTSAPASTISAHTNKEDDQLQLTVQQQQQLQPQLQQQQQQTRRSVSRGPSRAVTPAAIGTTELAPAPPMATTTRRPQSAGGSLEVPPSTLASERTRRASTARTTPAPDAVAGITALGGAAFGAGIGGVGIVPRPPSKRVKRPAPGVVSRTSSGGSAAVGRRKAAPRKKRSSHGGGGGSGAAREKRERSQAAEEGDGDVEVDDEGNVIDPGEARYCVCNRVSFGTMVECENVENCKQEWFHLECVGLTGIPARTTKWYCPDCRVLLNIGEKGEVSARGVKM